MSIKIKIRIAPETFKYHFLPIGIKETYVFSGFEGVKNTPVSGEWVEIEVTEGVFKELTSRVTPNRIEEEYGKKIPGGDPFFDIEEVEEESGDELKDKEDEVAAEYEKRQVDREANSN